MDYRKALRHGVITFLCITACFFFLLSGVMAAPFYSARLDTKVGSQPVSVATGLFNADAYTDVAVANMDSDNVSVLLGKGDGTFQTAVNYPVGDAPSAVRVGDFNGDGNKDLVVGNTGTDNVSVLLGNGNGTFQAAVNYAAGDGPASVAVGTLNGGDAYQDLVVANKGSNNVSVLLGNGNGTFQAAVNYPVAVGSGPVSVALGDFNGGGVLDLAVANWFRDTVAVLLGNGNGTFQVYEEFAVGPSPASVEAGDVNNDGNQDLVTSNNEGNNVSLLLGNGDGTFQAVKNFAAGKKPSQAIVLSSYPGDSALDIVVANADSGNISVLIGYGNGSFTGAINSGAGDTPSAVSSGDFNGDSIPDIVVADRNNGYVTALLSRSNGAFVVAPEYTVGSSPQSVAIGTLNVGDTYRDLAVANHDSDNVSVLLGKGNGKFQAAAQYAAGDGPVGAAIDDLDGDGDKDLAVANEGSAVVYDGKVAVLMNNGSGAFGAPVIYDTGIQSKSVVIGDFHGGGKDLAVANFGSGDVSVLLNNGSGTFSAAASYGAGDGPVSVAAGYLNGDAALDLAVVNYGPYPDYQSSVSVLRGNGDGTFQAAVNYQVGHGSMSVAIGDLDGDTFNDLAVANGIDSTVSVLFGYGDGTFCDGDPACTPLPVVIPVGSYPFSVAIDDLDGDTNLDIAVANYDGDNVGVLLGDGLGNFEDDLRYGVGDGPWSMAAGDLDGDTDVDLVVANSWSGYVSVLINNVTEVCHDLDTDGFGDPASTTCTYPVYDCNDSNMSVYFGAMELPDGIDNQCPGSTGYCAIDEGYPYQLLLEPPIAATLTSSPTFKWTAHDNDFTLFIAIFPYTALGGSYYRIPPIFIPTCTILPMPAGWWQAIASGLPCYWVVAAYDVGTMAWEVSDTWYFVKAP